ncbi:manganese efflux pump MntP [Plebeiibacterium marinum]|uniref:Putative manganese efflux pump MntP n=1 Tax=Plebeiibacterium marinum TaxID=2992111 RepID=A0AAE3SL08_9BACT|nr:manganese efflux pump MntP family protein [Plebeiobacterium marinum]MCW3807098.1 manganese efflux pump MntP family protein [Plebeiobacterium marinum]
MNILSLIIVGIGLSIDSLAASISTGACCKKLLKRHVIKVAAFMAIFQGGLPYIGWLIGTGFKRLIEDYDHWVAFILLFLIGAKLIYEGLSKHEEGCSNFNPTNNLLLAGMAIATSIDALVVGIGFGVIKINIYQAMLIIGITTFIFSTVGVYLGKKIGTKINSGIEIFGGLVLIGIGVKILIEHIYYPC